MIAELNKGYTKADKRRLVDKVIWRHANTAETIDEACAKIGISSASFTRWSKECGVKPPPRKVRGPWSRRPPANGRVEAPAPPAPASTPGPGRRPGRPPRVEAPAPPAPDPAPALAGGCGGPEENLYRSIPDPPEAARPSARPDARVGSLAASPAGLFGVAEGAVQIGRGSAPPAPDRPLEAEPEAEPLLRLAVDHALSERDDLRELLIDLLCAIPPQRIVFEGLVSSYLDTRLELRILRAELAEARGEKGGRDV